MTEISFNVLKVVLIIIEMLCGWSMLLGNYCKWVYSILYLRNQIGTELPCFVESVGFVIQYYKLDLISSIRRPTLI